LKSVVEAFLEFVDRHSDSWNVVYRQASAEPVLSDEVEKTRSVLIDLTTDLLAHSSTDDRVRDGLVAVGTARLGAGEAIAVRSAHRATEGSVAAVVVAVLAWRGLSGTPDEPCPSSDEETP